MRLIVEKSGALRQVALSCEIEGQSATAAPNLAAAVERAYKQAISSALLVAHDAGAQGLLFAQGHELVGFLPFPGENRRLVDVVRELQVRDASHAVDEVPQLRGALLGGLARARVSSR